MTITDGFEFGFLISRQFSRLFLVKLCAYRIGNGGFDIEANTPAISISVTSRRAILYLGNLHRFVDCDNISKG